MRDMASAEMIAARAEEASTAILGIVCIADGIATSVSNKHMVKPIPPSMPG